MLALALLALAASPDLAATFPALPGPPGVVEVGAQKRGAVTVKDLTFAGHDPKAPVKAYLVLPAGPGPFPGVLWVHWLGEPKTTNRTEFLEEAVALAEHGVASLLVDAMWAKPGWYKDRDLERDFESSVAQVQELRRGLDVLLSAAPVDPARVAYVGHDFGAMYGILVSELDARPKTLVLAAGTTSFVDWFLLGKKQPKDKAAYTARLEPLAPVKHLSQVKAKSVFLQFAATDEYVSRDNANMLSAVARPPSQVSTYLADHALAVPQAAADRQAWLLRELAPGAK